MATDRGAGVGEVLGLITRLLSVTNPKYAFVGLRCDVSLLRRSHQFTVYRLTLLRGPLLGPVLEQNADLVEQRVIELGFQRIRDAIDRLSPFC